MQIDEVTCHAAAEARDKRYDGLFFIGVTSTGIYCRCVCPARRPRRENRRFFPSAAAAERAGFRPCLLCRPELAPGASPVDSAERLAHSAVRQIEAGALEVQGVRSLARELGVTDRHLRRVMERVFGATPVEIAQTHRLLTAKRLLRDTSLSMTQIAFAAGFRSVRRFNALFRERYGMAPTRVRGSHRQNESGLVFTLAPRGAFSGAATLSHLTARCISGMEQMVEADTPSHGGHRKPRAATSYARTLSVGGCTGWIRLNLAGEVPCLTISDDLMPSFRAIVAAVRGALDLDTDIAAVNVALSRVGFAREVMRSPAVRLPGAIDPFEVAIRAVVGQQVTVKAATTVTGRMASTLGTPIETGVPGLDRLFPTPERLAEAGPGRIAALGMPAARARAVHGIATAVATGQLTLRRGAIDAGREGLSRIPGVGPWTIEYISLRALGDPDAFPLGDSALRSAFQGDLAVASEAWRPWRAYAAARLWLRNTRERRKAA